ncbi:MAG: Hsp20/alpha crystallin family protein [Candidatus Lambdaproteobacteria bacterium]|nr:Hsp20/alpha crystallin family protein [Candidatus Lambdaproteobacteria bacterium]
MNHKELGSPPNGDRGVRPEFNHPMYRLEKELSEVMQGFFSRWDVPLFDTEEKVVEGFHPRMDISEDVTALYVAVELPGLADDEFEVSLGDQTLTIAGEKKRRSAPVERQLHRRERAFGSFRRVIPLRDDVELEGIRAAYENGLLEIVLPRRRGAPKPAQHIPVRR